MQGSLFCLSFFLTEGLLPVHYMFIIVAGVSKGWKGLFISSNSFAVFASLTVSLQADRVHGNVFLSLKKKFIKLEECLYLEKDWKQPNYCSKFLSA